MNALTSALPAPSRKDSSRERSVHQDARPMKEPRRVPAALPRQLIGRHSFVLTEERPVGPSEEASLPRGFRKELYYSLRGHRVTSSRSARSQAGPGRPPGVHGQIRAASEGRKCLSPSWRQAGLREFISVGALSSGVPREPDPGPQALFPGQPGLKDTQLQRASLFAFPGSATSSHNQEAKLTAPKGPSPQGPPPRAASIYYLLGSLQRARTRQVSHHLILLTPQGALLNPI